MQCIDASKLILACFCVEGRSFLLEGLCRIGSKLFEILSSRFRSLHIPMRETDVAAGSSSAARRSPTSVYLDDPFRDRLVAEGILL